MVHETKFNLRISYSVHVKLVQLNRRQTSQPAMFSVVHSIPSGGNFIFAETFMSENIVQLWRLPRRSQLSEDSNLVFVSIFPTNTMKSEKYFPFFQQVTSYLV